jgi:pyruvate,water dikinase
MLKRREEYAMTVKGGQTKLSTSKEELKRWAKRFYIETEQTNELQGNIACLGGVIKGKAKVCFDKSEIGKVKRGDILVAQFTTPDFVPAMEKAAAIVADQGGLSSHAAIVSRELGTPCIIGTENSTRLIHDDDLVSVNAKTGVIKIIKRSKTKK